MEAFYTSFSEVEEQVKATSILTLIDRLPQVEKGARFFYEMLCDFVHPNAGSQFLQIDEISGIPGPEATYSLALRPKSEEALGVVLHIVSVPVRHSFLMIKDQLQYLFDLHERFDGLVRGYEERTAADASKE